MSWEDVAGFVICLGGLNPLCWAGCGSPSEVELEDEDAFPPPPDSFVDNGNADHYVPPDTDAHISPDTLDTHDTPDTHDAAADSDSDAEDSMEHPFLPDIFHPDTFYPDIFYPDVKDDENISTTETDGGTNPADTIDTEDIPQDTESKADILEDADMFGDTTEQTDSVEGTDTPEVICVPELCDNEDNDCDGLVDEDFAGLGNVCELGEGICYSAGYYVCSDDGAQAICDAEVIPPQEEVCDGLDNDCNGKTDEVCACIENTYEPVATECGEGACYSTGETSCKNGEVKDSCEPGEPLGYDDTCDYIDDDCDGLIDNHYVQTETSCGIGECFAKGAWACYEGGILENTCKPGTPAAEVCDGKDDDCDGLTDEGCECNPAAYKPISTTCGTGECASTGTTSCENGKVEDSCKPKAPASSDASCDGKDNDCDGVNDEDYVNVGTSCGKGECSSTGTKSCVAGNEVDSCKAGTPKPEVCDGKDNDCDGLTDEGMTDNNNNGICNELDCTVNEPLDKYLVLNCYTDPSLTAKMSVDACWGDLTSVGTLPGEMAYIGLDYFDVGTDFNGAGIKLCVHPLWTDCENNEPLPIACDHEIAFETKLFGTQYIWNLISPKPDDYQAEFHFDQTKNPDVASIQIFIFNNNAGCNYLYNAFSCN